MASRRRQMVSSGRQPPPQMDADASIEEIWSRPNWTPRVEKVFVQILTLTMNTPPPYAYPHKFSNDKWDRVREEFKGDTGLDFDIAELKKQMLMLKKRYSLIKPYYSANCHEMIVFDDHIWADIVQDTPEIKPYRRYGCPLYHDLVGIFRKVRATGMNARSSSQLPVRYTPAPTPTRINKRPSEQPSDSAPSKRIPAEAVNNVVAPPVPVAVASNADPHSTAVC